MTFCRQTNGRIKSVIIYYHFAWCEKTSLLFRNIYRNQANVYCNILICWIITLLLKVEILESVLTNFAQKLAEIRRSQEHLVLKYRLDLWGLWTEMLEKPVRDLTQKSVHHPNYTSDIWLFFPVLPSAIQLTYKYTGVVK